MNNDPSETITNAAARLAAIGPTCEEAAEAFRKLGQAASAAEEDLNKLFFLRELYYEMFGWRKYLMLGYWQLRLRLGPWKQ